MATSPRLRVQIRATTSHGKLTGYECYDVETRETISLHPVDAEHSRDTALDAARVRCSELNQERNG